MLHLLDKEEYQEELLLMTGEIHDREVITFFNDYQVQNSRRHIFSNTDDFKMAKKRIQETPKVADPDRNLSEVNTEIKNPRHNELDESYFK
jgi:hypothetical protein